MATEALFGSTNESPNLPSSCSPTEHSRLRSNIDKRLTNSHVQQLSLLCKPLMILSLLKVHCLPSSNVPTTQSVTSTSEVRSNPPTANLSVRTFW